MMLLPARAPAGRPTRDPPANLRARLQRPGNGCDLKETTGGEFRV